MKTIVGMLLVLVMAVPAARAQAVRPIGHPRIYVTADDVRVFYARYIALYSEAYSHLFTQGQFVLRSKFRADNEGATNAPWLAFMYMLGQRDPDDVGNANYLHLTIFFLDAMAANPPQDRYLTPAWIRTGCVCVDWVWGSLTPEQRTRYGLALIGMAEWVERNITLPSDFSNHFVNEHLSILYVPALLEGEGIAPDRVAALKAKGISYLYTYAMPGAAEIASPLATTPSASPFAKYLAQPIGKHADAPFFVGGQAEGFGYNDWGYACPLALTCEMWRTATGKDLFAGSNFFLGQGIWHVYALRADDSRFSRNEDAPSTAGPSDLLKVYLYLLAARTHDPLAEWMAEQTRWSGSLGWSELLWRDWNLKAQSPTEMNLPLAACFPKLGHVYFHSAWQNRDEAYALFQCGAFYSGHQHLDNNSFVIYRSGSLAIDSGVNDYGTHRGNYYCRTIAHNAILVYDPLEKFSGDPWSLLGPAGSNDGGQLRRQEIQLPGLFQAGGLGDAGRIVDFANGTYAAGCVGDATLAYSPHKVKRAVRAFYHLRSDTPPGLDRTDAFVVYDDVEVTNAKYPITWVIHSIGQPTLGKNSFKIVDQNGQLTGQVITPSPATLKLVGGPGKEFWVDGRNYPPAAGAADPEAGAWRIELPISGKSLVLLYAQAKGATPPPTSTVVLKDGVQVVTLKLGQLTYEIRLSSAVHAVPNVAVFKGGRQIELLQLQAWSTAPSKTAN